MQGFFFASVSQTHDTKKTAETRETLHSVGQYVIPNMKQAETKETKACKF
nr:hypothetical protein [Mucilaginibacter sp. X4EP1]